MAWKIYNKAGEHVGTIINTENYDEAVKALEDMLKLKDSKLTIEDLILKYEGEVPVVILWCVL